MPNMEYDAIEKLCNTYREATQIGLVLGAGVSKESGVPIYKELAVRLVEEAYKQKRLTRAPRKALNFLLDQFQSNEDQRKELDPDKIIKFVHDHIYPKQKFVEIIKQIIFKHVDTNRSHKMVGADTYGKNNSLNAVISFCSAAPGSPLAPDSEKRWETNPKVGGILTTNYDNLVEGSFGSKYGKSLLKPVAREGAREVIRGKRVIPVYHMHGYVSYIYDRKYPGGVKATELVIAEEDYYQTFYNLLGFSNVVAMSFLRRYPCIFIGCSMTDRNLRRILYHLKKERISSSDIKNHFAVMPPCFTGEDNFNDDLLNSFGVTVIRINGDKEFGKEVEDILKRVYLSLDGLTEDHWSKVKNWTWRKKKL